MARAYDPSQLSTIGKTVPIYGMAPPAILLLQLRQLPQTTTGETCRTIIATSLRDEGLECMENV